LVAVVAPQFQVKILAFQNELLDVAAAKQCQEVLELTVIKLHDQWGGGEVAKKERR